jgi:uncharacterized protein (TIGR00251 family)
MLSAAATGTLIEVRVIPRAPRSVVAGVRDGALLVRLAAQPVDGAANAALVALLAATLGVPRRDVSLVLGDRGRRKRVLVEGLPPPDVQARLAAAAE